MIIISQRLFQPDGAEAVYEYDRWGRCTQVINPENGSQRYQYDELDRVMKIRQFDRNMVELEYNAYEEVVFAKDHQHKVSFQYNALGSLVMRQEKDTKITFAYDTENRLTTLRNEFTEAYRFEYNKKGEVASETGFDGLKRSYERDRAGRVIKTHRPAKRWSEHEYDTSGRLARTAHRDGSWEIFSYNKNGLLRRAENEHSVVEIERDKMGRVTTEKQGEHFVRSTYNEIGQRVKVTSSLGADIAQEYDSGGRVIKVRAEAKEESKTEDREEQRQDQKQIENRKDKTGSNWEAQIAYNSLGLEIERLLPGNSPTSGNTMLQAGR